MTTQLSMAEAEQLAQAGVAALRKRDVTRARAIFQELISAGYATSALYLLQAQACRLDGDESAEGAALDQALATDPREINALIMKGDWYGRKGDQRAAANHYKTAIGHAQHVDTLSPQTRTALERAASLYVQANRSFEEILEKSLSSGGRSPAAVSSRVREALDILTEKKRPYFQEPTSFFFPGLPQRQFYERSEFPWLPAVERATLAIREELLAILKEDGSFKPYVEAEADRSPTLHAMLDDPSWGAFHILKSGVPVEGNAERCPRTLEALRSAPLPMVRGRSPMVLFSLLRPGAHITPHTGLLNTRLICHLPLIVPPGCALRVGNEIREWTEGQALIFDDSIEHEAWNRSDSLRVVLIFEIWRPEINEQERAELTRVFEAITDYGGGEVAGEEES